MKETSLNDDSSFQDLRTCLRISVVTFYIDDDIDRLLESIVLSAKNISNIKLEVIIVENGFKTKNTHHIQIEEKYSFCQVIITGANIGYGKAHNLTLTENADYHLILNPDIILSEYSLVNAIEFMSLHHDCGLVTPLARWRNGEQQYLCKNYPDAFTLLVRGFAPNFVRKFLKSRLRKYSMVDEISDDKVFWQPPIVSGCFMLFRNSVLLDLKGFDPRYFLYFEDTDLSYRAAKLTKIAYVPTVEVVHHGGNASRKGLKHISLFTSSMIKFFNKNGWKLF
ncbi:glycosyltransferase [Erwinia billingiae]|uniref:glycosyltransferase n=1 Tax=Erwinia billingiae TaxID=182337 RepID=UPI00320B35AE